MPTGSTTKKVLPIVVKATVLGAAIFAALSDPAWAIPANTLLLIVLAVIQVRSHKAVKSAESHAKDSARIAKELGGQMRESRALDTHDNGEAS